MVQFFCCVYDRDGQCVLKDPYGGLAAAVRAMRAEVDSAGWDQRITVEGYYASGRVRILRSERGRLAPSAGC